MSTTRTDNMRRRRERILDEARKMIASGGFEALKFRELAQRSKVTAPTIYNLVGNKEELLKALTLGTLENYETLLARQMPCPAADLPVLMAETFRHMILQEGESFRATALANEKLEAQKEKPGEFGFRRAQVRSIIKRLFYQSAAEGLLREDVDHALLVEQAVVIQQVAVRDWAHRLISMPAFYRRSLGGLYTTLAADAVDDYRAQLIEKLRAL
jgi:AcrR family transcriptional regulator